MQLKKVSLSSRSILDIHIHRRCGWIAHKDCTEFQSTAESQIRRILEV